MDSEKKQRPLWLTILIFVAIIGIYYYFGIDLTGNTNNQSAQSTPVPTAISDSSATPAPKVTVDAFPAIAGSGGDWWQVYFTNPVWGDNAPPIGKGEDLDLTGTVAEKLITYINSAQQTIHIASFEFNLTPVAEALIAAHKRGVDVRWMTDDEHGIEADEEDDHGQFAMLEEAGIEIRDDARGGLMHNKFWIFDSQTLWTGSTNITVNGMLRNNNNVVIIESPDLAAIYTREFEEMWAGEHGKRSPSTVDQQALELDGTSLQVLFAPEDEVGEKLTALLSQAEKSIHMMAFSFTLDQMGTAVMDRVDNGVEVQAIFETRGSETEYSELPLFYCNDIPVRQDGNPRTFHHKAFVIDGKTVATGSFNFSNNANESNDENIMIIHNIDIATQYIDEFNRQWAKGEAPDAEDIECP
ncbi:MAG: phospholipase D-like domain-containing protein [Chloroflexota bacterium]